MEGLFKSLGNIQRVPPIPLHLGTATRRTYDDGCAVAHALDLIGERWALLVVRELLLGPKRFTDLTCGLAYRTSAPTSSPSACAN